MSAIKRRHFLLGGAGAAGALVVGWLWAPPRQRLQGAHPLRAAPGESALNGWIKVGREGSVTVVMAQSEMGQGVHTALPMLVAEELDAAWESVRLEQAGFDPIYNNQAVLGDAVGADPDHPGFGTRARLHAARRVLREISGFAGTLGSSSIRDEWLPLREAGASARLMLIAAAAQAWQVAAADCRTQEGRVLHPSGRSASYGELAARAARQPLPRRVTLKSPAQFGLVGRPLRRLDNAAKLDGSARFAIDCEPPGLLYASVAMCPTLGGSVARFDASAALAMRGVHKAVALAPVAGGLTARGVTAGGVAVIADTPFRAAHALNLVRIDWTKGAGADLSSRGVFERLSQALDAGGGHVCLERGDAPGKMRAAARVVAAEYRVPFLAHVTLEPMNATVQFKDGAAMVWAGTQAPGLTRSAVAEVLGIAVSRVEVRVPFLGGGFGRRYLNDCVRQAAALARETAGRPVQLLWSREQDMTHDYYRPACIARCRAGLDARGRLIAWTMSSAGAGGGLPWLADAASDGASNSLYAFPQARVAHHAVEVPVPVGIWRSVAHSQNAFFVESLVDEAAAAAGADPLTFRERLLEGNAAVLRVLRRAASLAGWSQPAPSAPDGARCARGIGLHRCYGSIVAQVAEVSLSAAREIRVHRVACVIDCGVAVNPNLIRQQLEGGVVDGLSAALHGEITLEHGRVQQSNFHDYLPLRMYECPQILTEIIADGAAPGGVGETAVPPIAPAVANAVFALTGERLRTLPLRLG